MRYISNPPDAASLMMSARSFGNYDLAGALADLIDNSIKAKAKVIRLQCLFNDGDPKIRIADNGTGMSLDELCKAMRPASQNPCEERAPDDMGRFGWGMKSASFSQCRFLTVLTRKKGQYSGASWDLDSLDNWNMGIFGDVEVKAECSKELLDSDGTEIIWRRCDRLSEGKTLNNEQFNELIIHARNKLALIYHRFINGEVKSKKLTIELNGIPVPDYDPFHRKHEATMQLECEPLKMGGRKKIRVQPYILPHYSKLKPADLDKLSGDEGLLKNQGFYVYRNNRLIIYGTWFRLLKHGDLSQLVRISVDIPNSLDEIWKITVDKSDAQLPSILRTRLRQIVDGLKRRSAKVFRSKGGKVSEHGKVSVWTRYVKNGEIRYEINRSHPLLTALFTDASPDLESKLDGALQVIEREFPVNMFGDDFSKGVERINQAEANPEHFMDFLSASLPGVLSECNGKLNLMAERIRNVEPFSSNWTLVEDFLTKEGWTNVNS
ncbi:hypothetical protein H4684_001486 [Desulfomicrobium macestii]|uniref:ATP-binding protein n=1 Tax=Desulfomicrobium macestii TaxID=90731 RepID=A0ABR9H2R5_9BACT|nr:ATP-binding protein [Desulfomicrobium macestii]MBE1424847.1 hypothetical protein [Desulfomicrobium macestii]